MHRILRVAALTTLLVAPPFSTDTRAGAPVALPVHERDTVPTFGSAHWSTPLADVDGPVVALTSDGTTLYAGGFFVRTDDRLLNHVARWDGERWQPLGDGVNGAVYALAAADDGTLYAGGSFTRAGGEPASHIARWDGRRWHSLDAGMDYAVWALAVDADGTLYAGGAFTTAGDRTVDYIARWDGTRWETLGTGMNHTVFALALDGRGALYAGGGFTRAGDGPAYQVARWDGTRWHPLGSGMDMPQMGRPVLALATAPEGMLYAGGNFDSAGGIAAPNIARWDGQRWSALGGSVNGNVHALAVTAEGTLYAGGYFDRAGTAPARRVARWDGKRWMPLGGEAVDITHVHALVVDDTGTLHVAGTSTVDGIRSLPFLGCWSPTMPSAVDAGSPEEPPPLPVLHAAYPNPFDRTTTLSFTLPQAARVSLRVFDALGREQATLIDGVRSAGFHQMVLDPRVWPSGLYLYHLETGAYTRTGRVLLQR